MRIKKLDLFSLLVILLVSYIISTIWDIGITKLGPDMPAYINMYISNNTYGREVGFEFLINFFNFFNFSVGFFFGFICFFITTIYYINSKKILFDKNNISYTLLFFALIFYSSWYINAIVNGVRQGISLSILHFACLYFLTEKKYLKFILFFIIAILFHYSTILILPFLFLYLFSFKKLVFLWIVISIFYILGFNEIIFMKITSLLNLESVYFKIKDYSSYQIQYYGFNWDLFLYTVFPIIFFLPFYFLKKNLFDNFTINVFKLYMVLCFPYFIFGFSNYSNRYAVIAWFLYPLLILLTIRKINFKLNFLSFLIVLFLFISSIFYFCIIRLNLQEML
ncbi:EpsG family protein [Campylobacter ureolyticus]|uniref:EpsG family membrane protein n=1 Tax=Campylobacter ureolyticus TaxID=827 RepID=A0AAE7JPB2_9BACT|nr:EpsG family membrane protein [Campylobacter ureolyticus]SUX23255.1 Uncharacterised protein [Campylobacter ureolyticus]